MNKDKVKKAIADIIWMARRYSSGRRTYAPELFNDAYDLLREEFGDDIDKNYARTIDGTAYYDIALETSKDHPYALYGEDGASPTNNELPKRKFYKKPL